MIPQARAIQRFAFTLPRKVQVRSLSNGSFESSEEKTTQYVKTFLAAIKKDDPVVRELKQVKADYDKMGSVGRRALIINTVLANLYLGDVIGVVPILSGVGAYLSYKYLKHTGKLAQMRESLKSK